jgi:hypothetical protein
MVFLLAGIFLLLKMGSSLPNEAHEVEVEEPDGI